MNTVHTGLLTACEQDQDGSVLILLASTVLILTLKQLVLTSCFNIVTLASSHSTLPDDDGDHTEICWSYFNFNANFNSQLKTILLCISW